MKPVFVITYEGKDVTADFSPMLEAIIFRDYLENKASELELVFDNSKNYFLNDWYPSINDTISAKLGYNESALLDAGTFFIDDLTLNGGRFGEIASFRAISALASTIYSSQQLKNHEEKQLSELLKEEARKLGYAAKGDLSGTWSGIQKGTGFAFIKQLARETGRIMKVEATDLVFFPISRVKSGAIVGTINKADVIDYSITDKAAGRIRRCTIKCWKKDKKTLVTGTYDSGILGGGSRLIWEDVQDATDAKNRAKNYVEDWNKSGIRFNITVPGNVDYRAGVRISADGFGRFSKTWYVAESQHCISRLQGYTTTITLQE